MIQIILWRTPIKSRHRLVSSFIKDSSRKRKMPSFPNGNKDRIHILRYHLVCRKYGRLSNGASTPSALNAGNTSSDTQGSRPFPPALCGPFAAPLFAPLSASGTLCGCAMQLYSRFFGFNIGYAFYTPSVCVCQALFYAPRGQSQYSRTTAFTMPIISALVPSMGA